MESEVRSAEGKVSGVEWNVRTVEWKVWRVDCKVVLYGVRNVRSTVSIKMYHVAYDM